MMKRVLLEIIKNKVILLSLIIISCNSNVNKDIRKVMHLEVSHNLKSLLEKDLDCFMNNYEEIFKENSFLDIYAEKVEEGYDIHVSTSSRLEIDKNCHGYFYIDTVIFTVYGEFVPELYKNKKFQYIKSKYVSFKNIQDEKSQVINDEMISWHYHYENDSLSYLVRNNMCK